MRKEFAERLIIMNNQDTSKIKICYLADAGSIHTQRWCRHFSMLGFEIHLITFRNFEIEGTTVHFIDAGTIGVSGGNWKVLKKVPAIRKILKKIKPDILHAHYATSYGLAGALAGFHPYVITALGTDVLISPFESKLYRMAVKFALRKADWITAMADHMRDTIISLGIKPEKISTVVFGIDPEIFNTLHRNIDKGKYIITSTRNFEKVYNISDLIDAFAIVKKEIPVAFLNLIGSGSLENEVKAKVDECKLEDSVKFFGRISQTEIAETLRKTNVFVSVSSSDGNNISLNEAMACGCFSVVTDIPANQQWISEGINGYFVPVNNSVQLAAKLIYTFENYELHLQKCSDYNAEIIKEKGIWNENMKIVEKKYVSLSGK